MGNKLSEDLFNVFGDTELQVAGLNLQAVFATNHLPDGVRDMLFQGGIDAARWPTLVLFGNGGRRFWQAYQRFQSEDPHPVDAFSRQTVAEFMSRCHPQVNYQVLYPGPTLVPLQTLGQLAGWHHTSPMRVGINNTWGLWYAYRVLIAVDAIWEASLPVESVSPCLDCQAKPCIAACPAGALVNQDLRLRRCVDYRLLENSACSHQCLSRQACPVAPQHRYESDQIHYHYGHSLPCLREWRNRSET